MMAASTVDNIRSMINRVLDSSSLHYHACAHQLWTCPLELRTLSRCRCASSTYAISRNGESNERDVTCAGDASAICGGSQAVSTWKMKRQ